jgi:hypothetical protein
MPPRLRSALAAAPAEVSAPPPLLQNQSTLTLLSLPDELLVQICLRCAAAQRCSRLGAPLRAACRQR